MDVRTLHRHDDVEVDLQRVGHALLDAEVLAFMAAVPLEELGDREDGGNQDEGEGGVATGRAATGVGWFGLCCRRE